MLPLVIRPVRVSLAAVPANQVARMISTSTGTTGRVCAVTFAVRPLPPPLSEVTRESITLGSFQFILKILCLSPPRRRTDRSHGPPLLWTSRLSSWQGQRYRPHSLIISLGTEEGSRGQLWIIHMSNLCLIHSKFTPQKHSPFYKMNYIYILGYTSATISKSHHLTKLH